MKKTIALFALMSLLGACKTTQSVGNKEAKKPKNIILMIGDGMGLTQISAGMYSNGNRLSLEQFKHIGLHKSYSGDNLITDSSAGATAFATGEKTYNEAVGVGMDSLPRTTILELAERQNMATGLVATCNIQHATPASFIAHNKYRENYEEIAEDFLKTEIDLFIGGGKKYFDRRKKDNRNLLKELEQKGYYVSDNTKEDLERLILPKNNFAYLTADNQPLPAAEGRDYLPLASQLACQYLNGRSKEGFFLMIEGSQIDWAGHANKSDYLVSEMLDFDQAIAQVLDFAKKDGNTLVIVTADHETGGYSILKGSRMDSLKTSFSTDSHTADLIPVFAFGPGASEFQGIYENTDIFKKMKLLLGL